MDGQIDPAADALWDSVAYVSSQSGTEDRRPRTDEQWKAVRLQAINLIEAANLLAMKGRRATFSTAPPGPGELSPAQMQQRVDSSHDGFMQFARGLQDAAQTALSAIEAKDAQALMDAGSTIDQACEACHLTYWYPNQSRPGG